MTDDSEYTARAEAHKPKTPDEIANAARTLSAQGFSDHTISRIFKIDVASIRQMIGERRK